jgi:spore germination protein YaaH/flagellar hook assembly protein FlgD
MPGTVAHRRVALPAAALLVATLLVGLLPPSPALATDPVATGTAGEQPSTVYLEAMAHENDQVEFQPGGLVDRGFTPRASDRWPVDGAAPAALPAGRATGRQMAASPNGSAWAGPAVTAAPAAPDAAPAASPGATPPAPPAPVDEPAGDPALPAAGAAYVDPSQPAFDLASASGLRRQVFGFLPYWELSGASTKLNYDVLSTIAYFSVGSTGKGNLKKMDADGSSTTGWGGWSSSAMTQTINAAHQHGTRVVLTISVFAWTASQANVQKALLGSSTARLNLARQAAAAVRDRGADGINLDFEPLASGYADEFVSLLRTMRTELNRVRRGYQLTYDTTGSIGNYPLAASVQSGAADAIFIMGYDYRTGGSSAAGSIDPLSGPRYDLTDTVRAYTARVSPSRVILGLPWYGRAWSTTDDAVRSPSQSGARYGYSTAVNYENVTDLVARYGRRWDPVEQSPYVAYRRENCTDSYGCVTSWRQVYYDDGPSLRARLAMVNDYGLRGAGTWALGYDGGHPELYRAFAESFLVDKSAPQAGVEMLASTQADEGFVVTWSAKDTSAVAGFDTQVSVNGGAWTGWLTGTTATSGVWLGRQGDGYAFRVRARDAKGNVGSFNVVSTFDASPTLEAGGFGRVKTDGLAYRTGPDTSAAKLGTLDAGTVVAVTRGPVSADGATWYEVTQPIREWNPVTFVERGVWVAAKSGSGTHIAAYRAPNSTRVDAGLVGLDFGSGETAVGTGNSATSIRLFSPNGDGRADALRLRWTNTLAMDALELRVYRTDGTRVGTVRVGALASGPRTWDWDGTVGDARVADGRYVLQLVGTAAGKTYSAPSARPVTPAQVGAYAVTVDTVAPAITRASASPTLISPNGDGTRDRMDATLATTGAVRWTARVANATGGTVWSASGTGATATLAWAGTDNAGRHVPDGPYTVTLSTYDKAGNAATRSWGVTVDTRGPAITPSAAPPIFSPNGDGSADSTLLAWAADEKGSGTVRLYKGTTRVRSWTISRLATWSATWNGRNAAGAALGDGTYTLKVSLKDAAGNRRTATTPVVIDRTAGRLRWAGDMFPQDGDALRPTAALGWRQVRSATTTLRLYDATGALVRTVWTGKAQATGTHSWTWDGRLADGSFVPQGRYAARLSVTSKYGTQVLARSIWVAGFAITPSATGVQAGQSFSVAFSSVEPLATRPTLTFMQPGRAAVKVLVKKLTDGTYLATVAVRTGRNGTGVIKVSAGDSGGNVNTTSLPITIGTP